MSLVWALPPKLRRFGAIIVVYCAGWIIGGLIHPHIAMPPNGFVRFILYLAVCAITILVLSLAIKRILRVEQRIAESLLDIALYFFLGFYSQVLP